MTWDKYKTKKTDLEPTISIIRSDMHCPNTLLKRQGYSGYIKREVTTVCYIQKTHIRHKDTNRLKVIGQWYAIQIVTIRELEWIYLYQTKQTLRQEMLPETMKDVS